jgi:hypothetical protein
MRRHHLSAAVLPVLLFLLTGPPAAALWKSLKSDSFLLFYPAGRESEARQALGELEQLRAYAAALVGEPARRRLSVVLVDAGTQSNGFADMAFRRLHLYLYPPSDPDLGFAPSWWSLVGLHEYVHWLHLSSASGLPRALTWAFGDAWAPGIFGPAWLAEGLAVYAESEYAVSAVGPYQGRLHSGFFDAYLDARLQAGRPPGLPQALFVPPEFPGGEAPYLYGGEFVDYLARTHGQEAVTRFLQVAAGSALSYLTPVLPLAGLDRSARRVFGKRTAALWREWLEEAGQAQAGSGTSAIEAAPGDGPAARATSPAAASRPAWWMGAPVVADGRVYFLRSLPYPAEPFRQSWRHELRELGPGGERTRARFASAFSADLKWREGRLYFGLRDLAGGRANVELAGFGDTTVLYALDPSTGRRQRVLRAGLRAYEVLPGGDVVFSRDRPRGFGSDILVWKACPAEGEENPRLLLSSDYLIREILAREGRVFVSARRHGENFGMYEADPRTFRLSPILPGPYAAGGMDFAAGRLRFAANYGGSYAVYAWDPEAPGPERLTSEPYAVSPALDPATGLLWYVGLGPDGYALRSLRPGLAATGEAVRPPAAAEAAGTGLSSGAQARESLSSGQAFRAGGYGPNLATLAPRLLVPVLVVDAASSSYLGGASVLGRTALGDLAWSVTGLVDLATGEPAAEAALQLLTPPLAWSLAASTRQDGWLGAAVQMPAFRRLASLERSLDFGLAGYLYDGLGFPGRALQPFLELALGWPLDSMEGRAAFWLERVEWGAQENLARLEGQLVLEHAFRFGALRARLKGFQRLDGGQSALAPLRGNLEEPTGGWAAALNLDFFLRLLQIRAGTWNPPFFLQDVFLVPFTGAALTDLGQSQFTAGLELHWELKALAVGTGLPLDLTAGLAVNAEGRLSLFFSLGSPLEGLPLAGPEPGRMP